MTADAKVSRIVSMIVERTPDPVDALDWAVVRLEKLDDLCDVGIDVSAAQTELLDAIRYIEDMITLRYPSKGSTAASKLTLLN